MATLIELCQLGTLVPLDGGLEAYELPWRRLYATRDFVAWLDAHLGNISHDEMYSDLSPIEQVSALFAEYVAGEEFDDDRRFKKLSSTPYYGIWELKTTDVRIFGWSPEKDTFICCYGDSADQIKLLDLYGRYIAQTKYVMDHLDLNEPKAILGTEYDDVISTQN